MERMYADAEDENDFVVSVVQKFGTKLSLAQSAILRTLAVAFYRNGPGKAPKLKTGPKTSSKTAAERLQQSMARMTARLANLNAVVEIEVEKRLLMLPTDCTLGELYTTCEAGRKLGKKPGTAGSDTLVRDQWTVKQLSDAGLGLTAA
jgi:hypothetical protein